MDNIVFDLETLGNTSEAPIIQIGAVKFDENGKVLDSFERNVNIESLGDYNFKVDYPTVMWWFNQDDKAIKSVFGKDLKRVKLRQALYEFVKWVGKLNDYSYWSHATFDPPILRNNFNKVGSNDPIPFRLHRDIRTLTHLAPDVKLVRADIPHNALEDAKAEALYISRCLKFIKH